MKVKATTDGKKLIPLKTTWEAICSCFKEGQVLDISIDNEAKKRTDAMNNYIHVLIRWWNREQLKRYGNILSEEEAKTCLKLLIKWYDLKQIKGPKGIKTIRIERTTHDKSIEEINEFIKRIADWTITNWNLEPPNFEV